MSKAESPQICRACLESSQKLYPLVGTVVNVDVNIATMISYSISKEFKESEEILLMKREYLQEAEHLNHIHVHKAREVDEGETNINISEKSVHDESNLNKTNLIKYNLETIHNYAEKHDPHNIVDINIEDETFLFCTKLQEVSENEFNDIQTKEYTASSLTEYVEDSDNTPELLTNPSKAMNKVLLILDKSDSELEGTKNKPNKRKLVQKVYVPNFSAYTCPLCNLTFQHLPKFSEHVVLHGKNIMCNKCPKPVELNMSQYIQHYKELHRYQCNICDRSLMSSYGFRYHMKQHENVRKYVCPAESCKKSFFLHHLLKKHMTTHSNIVKYSCNLCGANFRTYDTYRYQKTHDGKCNYLCTECGKAFFQSVHLRDHMFRHTGYKRLIYDICGNSFTTKFQLKKHLNHCLKMAAMRSLSRFLSCRTLNTSVKRGYADEMSFTFAAGNQVYYDAKAVKQVDVPSFSGSFGILPAHVPTLAVLKPGVVSVFEDGGKVNKIFVSSGTVTINDDSSVQILAEEAHPVENIDAAAARDLLSKAQSQFSSATTDQAKAEAEIAIEVGEALVKATE
ncbi:hypothetical protein NQ314_000886 [Rhamnusium bicolor]|uniref:ATP synthase F(1) complex subunit delta, mitochondrial n=1 Tax=Rhamnusium bicolor TaxID=1586634 RepID=A0AAV8ZU08_9CUCU|nr:hypothetical protein NQ314_000886 [Rhamnusium bicolor]